MIRRLSGITVCVYHMKMKDIAMYECHIFATENLAYNYAMVLNAVKTYECITADPIWLKDIQFGWVSYCIRP